MLRLRSGLTALASGLLLTFTGCFSSNPCDSGPMFPRLFGSRSSPASYSMPDCECGHSSFMSPSSTTIMQGPALTMPAPMPMSSAVPTITNVPVTQPQTFKMPAAGVPYVPSN